MEIITYRSASPLWTNILSLSKTKLVRLGCFIFMLVVLINSYGLFTGMVFGSQTPWAESMLVVQGGAKKLTTVEYMKITSSHPKLSSYHPMEIAKDFVAGKVEQVDFAFSFSSFEHDGLGAYFLQLIQMESKVMFFLFFRHYKFRSLRRSAKSVRRPRSHR